MRRPLASAALALFASALCLASGAPPKVSPGPSMELLDTACGSGLLLQRKDADAANAAPDDDAGGSIFGDSGLFGSSGGDRKSVV